MVRIRVRVRVRVRKIGENEFVRERGVREGGRNIDIREMNIIINIKKVANIKIVRPSSKSNKKSRTKGNKIIFFIFGPKFASNMTDDVRIELVLVNKINTTHPIA